MSLNRTREYPYRSEMLAFETELSLSNFKNALLQNLQMLLNSVFPCTLQYIRVPLHTHGRWSFCMENLVCFET